jgi:hypothetical protein
MSKPKFTVDYIPLNGAPRDKKHIDSLIQKMFFQNATGNRAVQALEVGNVGDQPVAENENKQYSFSYTTLLSYFIASYTIQQFINEISSDKMILGDDVSYNSIDTGNSNKLTFLSNGTLSFILNGKIYTCTFSYNSFTATFSTEAGDINFIKNGLTKEYMKSKNPLIGKCFSLYPNMESFYYRNVPDVTFDNVILNKELKDDIYLNTIYHLETLDDNNGIIFHGQQGSGKTLCCQAIINDSLKRNYTVIVLTERIPYKELERMLIDFFDTTVVIFEDIDSLGQDRTETINTGLSEFLQFINGVSEGASKMLFIATTNYIEHLDKAISNRPMRFNRKIKFELPTNMEIDQMIKLYFDKQSITKQMYPLCHDKGFTGAHIKEIRRTANLLSKRKGIKVKDVFEESVKVVHQNFSVTINSEIGFKN